MKWRWLAGVSGAALVTLSLFWLMQSLLHTDDLALAPPAAAAELLLARVVTEPPPPPPPPIREKAPEALTPLRPEAMATAAPVALPSPELTLPTLESNFVVTGKPQTVGVSAGVAGANALAAFSAGGQSFSGAELVPVSSARPKFPRSAAERGIEGWVELIFVVTGSGRVENIRILDASPRGVFEDAAVSALQNWLYAPYYVNGQPVAREGTQLFRFRSEDIQDIYLWND
ncbi:MAG: energy transducer TonB [Gammaproteobacteria bacterium]|nr:energy transducer TonB [Gammaproteobacteria bacterium]